MSTHVCVCLPTFAYEYTSSFELFLMSKLKQGGIQQSSNHQTNKALKPMEFPVLCLIAPLGTATPSMSVLCSLVGLEIFLQQLVDEAGPSNLSKCQKQLRTQQTSGDKLPK